MKTCILPAIGAHGFTLAPVVDVSEFFACWHRPDAKLDALQHDKESRVRLPLPDPFALP